MNEDYKGFTIYSANKDGGGTFWYMDGVVFPEKYKSLAAAKGAITRHLNKRALPDIVVVPRTQQEIDDYGPNGIQPPKSRILATNDSYKTGHMIFEVIPNALRGKFTHPIRAIESRNKREGGYCGRYKAGDKNFKMAHYRVGPKREFDTLKQTAKANRYFTSYGL